MWYYSSKKYCAVKALKHQPLFYDKFIEQYPRLLLYKQKLLNDAKVGCAGNAVVTLSTALWLRLISKVWTTELPTKQPKWNNLYMELWVGQALSNHHHKHPQNMDYQSLYMLCSSLIFPTLSNWVHFIFTHFINHRIQQNGVWVSFCFLIFVQGEHFHLKPCVRAYSRYVRTPRFSSRRSGQTLATLNVTAYL